MDLRSQIVIHIFSFFFFDMYNVTRDPLPSTYMGQLSHSCYFPSSIGSILLILQFNVFAFNWIRHSSYLFHVHFNILVSLIIFLRFVRSLNGLCIRVYDVPTLRIAHRVVGWTFWFMPEPFLHAWPSPI